MGNPGGEITVQWMWLWFLGITAPEGTLAEKFNQFTVVLRWFLPDLADRLIAELAPAICICDPITAAAKIQLLIS